MQAVPETGFHHPVELRWGREAPAASLAGSHKNLQPHVHVLGSVRGGFELLAEADRILGANFFAPAAIRAPAPEELQHSLVLLRVREHNHAGRADVGASAASEAEISIESDLAAESGFGIVRRKRVPEGHTPGLQANQGFSQFAQEHLNLLPASLL
jgi:hypothetical protein